MNKKVKRLPEETMKQIFAHAVALDQNGRLRNTIYAKDSTVYVLNSDNTVLLRFNTGQPLPIDGEVRFKASDYEGDSFQIEDGKMVFTTRCGGVERKKSCGLPDLTFDDVEHIFDSHEPDTDEPFAAALVLTKDIVSILDENLSHVEISGDKKAGWLIVQRDIYSGAKVEIRQIKAHGMGVHDGSEVSQNFGPIGLRTNDFIALFLFHGSIRFDFQLLEKRVVYIEAETAAYDLKGVVAQCVYDEMGTIGATISEESEEKKKPTRRTTKK